MPSSARTSRIRSRHLLGLLGVHARDGLVEQQERGLAAERAPELDALAVAVGQAGHRAVEQLVEPDERRDLAHALDLLGVLAACAGAARGRC